MSYGMVSPSRSNERRTREHMVAWKWFKQMGGERRKQAMHWLRWTLISPPFRANSVYSDAGPRVRSVLRAPFKFVRSFASSFVPATVLPGFTHTIAKEQKHAHHKSSEKWPCVLTTVQHLSTRRNLQISPPEGL